jgi:hypothetical protein
MLAQARRGRQGLARWTQGGRLFHATAEDEDALGDGEDVDQSVAEEKCAACCLLN